MKKLLYLILIPLHIFAQNERPDYPTAYRDTVKDNYFGTIVADPYRWLENDTLAATKQWLQAEKEFSSRYLDKLRKKYNPEKQLLINSYMTFGTSIKSGAYYFDFIRNGEDIGASLYIKKHIYAQEAELINPNDYDHRRGERVEIDNFDVSQDDNYLAFSLSYNGSDWQEIHVISLYPARRQSDIITGVKFSNIVWSGDGFFYKRYPTAGDPAKDLLRNASIWYHKLGTVQGDDRLILRNETHPDADIDFKRSAPGNYLFIDQHFVEDGEPQHIISAINLDIHDNFRQDTLIQTTQKAAFDVIGVFKNCFLARTDQAAPKGRLILLSKDHKNKAESFIPAYKEVLRHVSIIGNKVVCKYLNDIDCVSVTFDTSGKPVHQVTFPPGTTAGGFTKNNDSEIIFYFHSFLHPPIVYMYNVNSFKTEVVEKTQILYSIGDLTMEKVYGYSKDSTRVPIVLAHKKNIDLDGSNPTILYGYGGYGISSTPFYDRGFLSFIQNGGIIALACIRGGGEYGEEWHEEGRVGNKQNSFDDFSAAADYLVAERYTIRDKLALMGGSNGGLLVAAVVNQRPDICKAIVAEKGVYDMLRYQKFTVGAYSIPEFGTSDNPEQFNYLKTWSPLHNIRDTNYPAVLIVTADHDDRAVPLHSYKYAAEMQHFVRGNAPVLLYVEKNRGHQGHDLEADISIYSFLYSQLGFTPRDVHTLEY